MMEGLLTAYEFFKNGSADEQAMCSVIQQLWQNVDWDWRTNRIRFTGIGRLLISGP
jgi:hypothetical protein